MNTQLITEAKALSRAVTSALKGYQKARENMHIVVCSCANYAKEHGDTTQLQRLLEDMGARSQTRHRIAAYVRQFSQYEHEGKTKTALAANINDKGVKVRVGKQAVREHIDIEGMLATPYWEAIQPTTVKADFELHKAVVALVKKAAKEGYSIDNIKADIDNIKIEELEPAKKTA